MKQEKKIETPMLEVKGNIMIWERTMIQLSNVSCISEATLEKEAFPKWSVFLLLVGFVFIQYNMGICFILIGCGVGWIVLWDQINKERERKNVLVIDMNSGNQFCLIFNNKVFLHKVLKVLERIILEGGIGEKKIVFNIKDSKFGDNANVMNNANVG